MRRYIFLLLLALPATSWAGKLDMDYYKPSPAKAFMWSTVVPGGGMFYLNRQLPKANRQYFSRGMIFLLTEGAAVWFISYRANKGKGIGVPLAGLLLVKIFEFDSVIEEAETMRHNRMLVNGD